MNVEIMVQIQELLTRSGTQGILMVVDGDETLTLRFGFPSKATLVYQMEKLKTRLIADDPKEVEKPDIRDILKPDLKVVPLMKDLT